MLALSRISATHIKDLRYRGQCVYFGKTYYVYEHRKIGGHYAMIKLDLTQPIYLYHFYNYNLITNEPRQDVIL